ncbi:hypothetical protein C8Q76DRAFT_134754 [Earliella scabrosa]|nr:hypothetical protein C8Q76DRAFT_134754 [Earliella scabrosa]
MHDLDAQCAESPCETFLSPPKATPSVRHPWKSPPSAERLRIPAPSTLWRQSSSCRTRSEFAPLPHRHACLRFPSPPTARRCRASNTSPSARLIRARRQPGRLRHVQCALGAATSTREAEGPRKVLGHVSRSLALLQAVHVSGHQAQGGSGPCCMRHGAAPHTSTRPCRLHLESPRLQNHRLDRRCPRPRLYLRAVCARIQPWFLMVKGSPFRPSRPPSPLHRPRARARYSRTRASSHCASRGHVLRGLYSYGRARAATRGRKAIVNLPLSRRTR